MIKKTLIAGTLFVSLFSVGNTALAQYAADSATLDSVAGGNYQPRLFTDAGFTTPVGANTVVWFVASTDSVLGSGTGAQLAVTANNLNGFLGSDDRLIAQLTVDGVAQGGLGAGMFESGGIGGINSSNSSANIYAVVWNRTASAQAGGAPLVALGNGTYAGFITPNLGDTFGFLSLGVQAPPGIGNANFNIVANLYNSQFTFAAVPEPSTIALVGLGSLGLILRRRLRK